MTTTEKLISDCDQKIERLQRLKALFKANEPMLNTFGSAASVGTGGDEMIFLHDPPPDVKEFCRAFGGK